MEQTTQEVKMDNIDIEKLKAMNMTELNKIAKGMKVNSISGLKKQELIFRILQTKTRANKRLLAKPRTARSFL